MNNNLMEDLDVFVGKKDYYYRPRFESFVDRDAKASWNWPTLFVPVLWMAYRKMYVQAIILYLVEQAVSYGLNGSKSGSVISLIIWLGFPIFANYLYFRHAESNINKVSNSLNDEERREKIRSLGGTSWLSVFIFMFATIIISIVLFIITGGYAAMMEVIARMSAEMGQ